MEKLKGSRHIQSTEAVTREKTPKKPMHAKSGSDTHKLHKSEDITKSRKSEDNAKLRKSEEIVKVRRSGEIAKVRRSEDIALKQTEPVRVPVESQHHSYKADVERKFGTEVEKPIDKPPVQQQMKIVSLLDLNLTSKYRQPAGETYQVKKAVADSVSQKESVEDDRKLVTGNSQRISHSKVETDKTVVAHRKASEITPPASPSENEQEKVDLPPAEAVPSAVPEADVEQPTTEAEPTTNDTLEMLPPISDELPETVSKLESVQPEQAGVQHVTAEKTEVSAKNVAQVKPLLVANVPEKSKWERDADVSDSRDSPLYTSRDRDRPSTAKTTLPRYVRLWVIFSEVCSSCERKRN